jgi:L,D-peptidoglycan transpeptidase YkuD (ErfK/YbiS/YcfS/YnhG family)
MHIYIKNKKLSINHYKVKCAVGKRGIGIKRREGDLITPKGKYKIKCIYYRKDRVTNFKSKLPKFPILKDMGWCDDPASKKYNKLVKFPHPFQAEKFYRKDNVYDIVLVLNYNLNPIIKNKGSAIFIHIAKKNYKNTAGCIAISKTHLKKIIKIINKKTIVYIN